MTVKQLININKTADEQKTDQWHNLSEELMTYKEVCLSITIYDAIITDL